jgi:hypothetical protein
VRRLSDLRDDAIVGRRPPRAPRPGAADRPAGPAGEAVPPLPPLPDRELALLNAATLNNDEIVGLADAFVAKNAAGLAAAAGARAPAPTTAR